jgi:uncharacterized Zn-binding protein involved in type VI secretion
MPVAARIGDPIQHSNAMVGLLAGLAVGLVIGAAIVVSGGAAAVVLVASAAGAATGAAGIGSMLGSLSIAGGTITGAIVSGSADVLIDGLPATRAFGGMGDSVRCDGVPPLYFPPSHHGKLIAQGSASVLINGEPAARVGDYIECGAQIQSGSISVLIEGGQVNTLEIASEVPAEINTALTLIGLGSSIILVGPVLAIAGLLGGAAGGAIGGAIAEGLDPGSEDAKIIGSFLGGFLGGFLAGRAGKPLARNLGARVGGPWGQFIEGGLPQVYAKPPVLPAAVEEAPPPPPPKPPPRDSQVADFVDNQVKDLSFEPPPRNATPDLPEASDPSLFSGTGEDNVPMGDVARRSGSLTVNESEGGIAAANLDNALSAEGLTWDARRGIWVAASKEYAEYIGQNFGTVDPQTGFPLTGPKAGQPVKVYVSEAYMNDPARFQQTIFWQTERPVILSYGVDIQYIVSK